MLVSMPPDAAAATAVVFARFAALVRARPDALPGPAIGGTMESVLDGLIAAHRAELRYAGVTTFNMEEYVGLTAGHRNVYPSHMQGRFFDHVDIDPASSHLPDGHDPAAAALRYETPISRQGPIDLQSLGLGRNGHAVFNEPSSSLGSLAWVKLLMRSTHEANSRSFDHPDQTPRKSITPGIASSPDARRIQLLSVGADQAEPEAQMVEGPISDLCPGTAFQTHSATRVVIDNAAGTGLIHADHDRADGESGL